jgi:hypothetical protein
MDGGTTLAATSLNSSGKATYSTNTLGVGSHRISAVYLGNSTFASNTTARYQSVAKAGTTTNTPSSSTNPSIFGQLVTVTATVVVKSPGSGLPTGTVTFKDGSATLGTSPLDGTGRATFSTIALSVGNHTITAIYNGSGTFNSSLPSAPLVQTVKASASVLLAGQVSARAAAPSALAGTPILTATDEGTSLSPVTQTETVASSTTAAIAGHSPTPTAAEDAYFASIATGHQAATLGRIEPLDGVEQMDWFWRPATTQRRRG